MLQLQEYTWIKTLAGMAVLSTWHLGDGWTDREPVHLDIHPICMPTQGNYQTVSVR